MKQRDFATAEELSADLAGRIADALRQAIKARGGATLAVSGGTTPGRLFDALALEHLDWTKVIVTLVDERFVEPGSDRSNEGLVRSRLLVGEARLARFVPLYSPTSDVDQAASAADAAIALLPQPLDVVVLGMGTDGHTASFFPDAANLADLLDPQGSRRVLAVATEAGGEPRLTLTLPVIVSARLLVLHVEGEAKRAALAHALGDARPHKPIRAVIDAAPHIEIFWAP